MSDKLKQLIELSKCSVTVTVNDHKCCHMSVIESLLSDKELPGKKWQKDNGVDLTDELLGKLEVSSDVLNGMIDNDTIIIIQFFPKTPVGSFTIYHYDIDKAFDDCLVTFKRD